MITDKLGIYIHIPFCLSKCHYCDFCSLPAAKTDKIDAYAVALLNEIATFANNRDKKQTVDTVYFGGGTPTLLSVENLSDILSCVKENFELLTDVEITIEANPKTADRQKLSDIRSLGVNRLSIGMQSVHDGELKALGRIHTYRDFEQFYYDSRKAGFDNVSVDLMYGIPMQSMDSFDVSLRRLCELSPEHISSYCLKIEENTRFYQKKDTLALPDEDTVCDMYEHMSNILSDAGYNKYEISNFSREGKESRHNLKYWKYDDYTGFGSGAHSYVDGVRYSNSRDIDAYIATLGLGAREDREYISKNTAKNEYVMLRMRLARGIDASEYRLRFSGDFMEDFGNNFKKFSPEFVTVSEKDCRFTDRGMLVSNYILSEILDFS